MRYPFARTDGANGVATLNSTKTCVNASHRDHFNPQTAPLLNIRHRPHSTRIHFTTHSPVRLSSIRLI